MIYAINSPAIGAMYILVCLSNAGYGIWLLNTRYQSAALTYRVGTMLLAAGNALAAIAVIWEWPRPIFPSDLVIQSGLCLMFGLLARDQRRRRGLPERRQHGIRQ